MMHLAHPALTTTGKKKGKVKFSSAEHKRRHQELDAEWQRLEREWASMSKPQAFKPKHNSTEALRPKYPPGREPRQHIPSVESVHLGAVSGPQTQVYTGDKVLGISIVHKSCLQPVFSEDQAKDFANMRR